MKYLPLIMIILNALVIYKTNKLRKETKSHNEIKNILKQITPLWKKLINLILFGIAIFLLSLSLKTSGNLLVNKVYNIIVIIYVLINLFVLITSYKKMNMKNNKLV